MERNEQDHQPRDVIAEVASADIASGAEAAAEHTEQGADDAAHPAADAQVGSNSDNALGAQSNATEQPPAASHPGIITAIVPPPLQQPPIRSSSRFSLLPVALAASALLGVLLLRRLLNRAGASAPSPRRRPASSRSVPPAAVNANAEDAAAVNAESPGSPLEPIDPDTLEVLVCGPSDPAVTAAAPPLAGGSLPLPLAGVTFMVSEDIDLVGTPTTLGRDPRCGKPLFAAAAGGSSNPQQQQQPAEGQGLASASCTAVSRLQAAGAVCLGKAAMQPLGLDTLGSNYGNPYNKACVSGGGQTGSAVAVATGLTPLAVVTDLLGSARVPAACCGLYCYRSTPGVLGPASQAATTAAAVAAATGVGRAAGGGSSGGGGSDVLEGGESLSLMASDVGLLLKAAQVLGVPGHFNLRGEIVRFVVAEDLFALCAVEYQPAVLAVKRAILKWAGQEQAGAVQLCSFLAENIPEWHSVTPDELLGDVRGLPEGLAAWATAGRILRAAHVNARMPQVAADMAEPNGTADDECEEAGESGVGEAADMAAATAAGASDGQLAVGRALHPRPHRGEGIVDAEGGAGGAVAAAAVAAGGPTSRGQAPPPPIAPPAPPAPRRLTVARDAARWLNDTLRYTVKPDTVIVLPVVPAAPLKRSAAAGAEPSAVWEVRTWEALTHSFSCLASLSEFPVVVVPLGTVADGTPLAVALMGCGRFDARLLTVAAKMGPIMQEAFEGVKQGLAEAVRRQNEKQQETAASAAAAAAPPPEAAGGRRAAGGAAAGAAAAALPPPPSVDPRRLERAERFKARGNNLFRAGKFGDALTEYSKAINEHPDNPIYYNNRAMACLKIFRFEQAEEDCNRALKFELKEADKAKALLRRATARTALQKYNEAEADLRQVLSVEPNNRQAREDLMNLQQMKADMAAAQQRMVAEFQAQRRLAAGAAPGAPQPGGGDGGGGSFPLGFDPSSLPPGLDMSQLAAAAGGNPEALMGLMEAAAASGNGGGGSGFPGGGFRGQGDLGPMFRGGGGARR